MNIEQCVNYLKCPDCQDSSLKLLSNQVIRCDKCGRDLILNSDGIWEMMPLSILPFPEVYKDLDYLKWKDIIIKKYDSIGFFQQIIERSSHKWISKRLLLNNKKFILDVGCGTGNHFPFFNNISNVIGFDIHLPSLSYLKKKFPEAFLIHGSIYSLPFKTKVFSDIIAVYLFEHVYYLDLGIKEVERVLRPGGFLLVGLPCEGGWLWNTVRKYTSEIINSWKYKIDYKKVAKIDHCNKANQVIEVLKKKFTLIDNHYFPLGFKNHNLNLTVSLRFKK